MEYKTKVSPGKSTYLITEQFHILCLDPGLPCWLISNCLKLVTHKWDVKQLNIYADTLYHPSHLSNLNSIWSCFNSVSCVYLPTCIPILQCNCKMVLLTMSWPTKDLPFVWKESWKCKYISVTSASLDYMQIVSQTCGQI